MKLPGGKAPGVDEICSETLKALDIVGLSCLTFLFSVPWGIGTVPLQRQTEVVALIYIKGDRRVCRNCHCITLFSLPERVYSI